MMTMIHADDGDAFRRALQRAEAHHLRVIGFRVAEEYEAFFVVNPGRGGGHYTVTLYEQTGALTCNCAHGMFHGASGWCHHKAKVVDWLVGNC